MDLARLTRKHGIKIAPAFPCSVEECSLAVGRVVGNNSVKSAARMNNAVVIFLDSVDKVNTVVASGIEVNDAFVSVLPLATPAVKVTLSNVPPFIRDETLVRELARHGKIVSQVKKVSSGCKSPLLKHVVSHRRHLFMILNNRTEDLNLVFKIRVEEFDYVIFVTSNNTKCFSCGKEGHQAKVCPQKNKTADTQEQQEGTGGVQQESQVSEEGTGGVPGEGQVNEEGQKGTEVVQQAEQMSEEGTSGVQQEVQVNEEGTGEVPKEVQVDEGQAGGIPNEGLVSEEGQEGTGRVQQAVQVAEGEQEETGQVSDIDMERDEEVLKVPRLKRKTRSNSGTSKAKKGTVKKGGGGAAGSESSMETDSADSESSDFKTGSQKSSRSYSAGKMKVFLQKTKNMKGLKLEDYFSDAEQFSNSARLHMSSKGRGGFTDQEVYRLKKIVQKIRQQKNNDDDDDE